MKRLLQIRKDGEVVSSSVVDDFELNDSPAHPLFYELDNRGYNSMKLTQAELDAMPAKTKKDPAVVALYLEHDFATAYALHTDKRVLENGPEAAIGNHLEWESMGRKQFDFLVAQGMKPEHRLFEIGCGTGRLARHVVPYLQGGNYLGSDFSAEAVEALSALGRREGWYNRLHSGFGAHPSYLLPEIATEYLFAFSVYIHCPAEIMRQDFARYAERMSGESRLYFSYVPEKVDARTGLKQFRHTLATYQDACRGAGLTFSDVESWPGPQRMAVARRGFWL